MNDGTKNVKGLYVHVPFCDGKCFYCAFYSLPYESRLACRYLQAIKIELERYPRLNMETIYFGGGTPSLLSVAELETLCGFIRKNVSFANLKEWTVEINPGSLSSEKTAVLKKAGVNRLSIGAQSFDDSVLKWLGRRHGVADIYETVRLVRKAGFDNFGLDLIAGVPGLKLDVWIKTVNAAAALEPKHISVYALTKEEGSRMAGAVSSGQVRLLTDDEELENINLAADILADKGYWRYEISNYAKKGFECLHNLSCWRGEEYIGLGPAAASYIGLQRWTNLPDLGKYLETLEQGKPPPRETDVLNEKLKQVEKIVFGLRMTEGVSEKASQQCRKVLLALREEGLVLNSGSRWRLTERGLNLADYVGAELLAGAG